MADATFQACVSAIRARVEILPSWRGKNAPAAARAGLVTMAHAIDALARRYLEPLDWPGHEVPQDTLDLWLVGWYTSYCAAVLELAEAAQAASKSGALKLRSVRTRALLADGLSGWPGADLRAEAQSAKLFYECAQWGPLDAQWPDGVPMPPGYVSPADADAWAVGAGVAQPGALLALLDIVADSEQTATAGPLTAPDKPAPAGGAVADWQEAARDEAKRIRTDRAARLGTAPSLEVLGDEVAKVFRAREITGPNGHPLTGAYINRWALQGHGVTSPADKLRSIGKHRGK